MTHSSRYNAKTWPYPRHKTFEDSLRKSNETWFSARKYPLNPRMGNLLAHWENWHNNIILPEVVQYIEAERTRRSAANQGFPLHKYIHHGLSSQAMLFNLVGPLVVHNNLAPLQMAFERSGIQWPSGEVTAAFEVENREIFNEDSGQPTSIDLVLRGESSALYIESKLVEREFGGCSVFADGDCSGRNPATDFKQCYLHHLGRRYWSLLEKHGFLAGPAGSSPICPLTLYYQFFREVLFAIVSRGDFVLLYDERNPTFYCGDPASGRGLMPFLMTFVPEGIKSCIHSISIQQVVVAYKENGSLDWVVEFEKKYGLIDPTKGIE